MSSYRQILYHIIFRTKNSHKTLAIDNSDELYAYLSGIIKKKGCFPYQINGIVDHIHILSVLHPSIALADFMRDVKTSSSIWLKASPEFPNFESWGDSYAALTYSWKDKDMIINYIKNQKEHHKHETFEDELRRILVEFGIEINDIYFP